jgi:hypothetical protein
MQLKLSFLNGLANLAFPNIFNLWWPIGLLIYMILNSWGSTILSFSSTVSFSSMTHLPPAKIVLILHLLFLCLPKRYTIITKSFSTPLSLCCFTKKTDMTALSVTPYHTGYIYTYHWLKSFVFIPTELLATVRHRLVLCYWL